MKQRLKGLLALVLSLTMVFALATNAWAAATSVKIGHSVTLDSTTPYWKNGDTTATATASANGYNAYFDNGILTLNGANIDNTYYGYGISANGGLTINLIGDNTVTHNDSGGIAAIHVDGDLTIKEDHDDGSLTASDTGTNFDGILASGEVTIESGKVTATGGNYGIGAKEGITISGGTVTATGDEAGIHSDKTITITGGTVTATGDEGRGIYTKEGNITISGGTVEATGKMYGIFADKGTSSGGMKVTISGGSVEAYATNDTGSIGIYAPGYDGEIAISGDNTQVTVGCATGLAAEIVNIAGGSTLDINAENTNNENAIDSDELNMSGDYQWTDKNGGPYKSNDNQLDATKAAATNTLTIEKISTGGPGAPQPPAYYPIYIPTVEDEPEVTAPNTFDGGIASAVVVTILSATGGAWLAKKKD